MDQTQLDQLAAMQGANTTPALSFLSSSAGIDPAVNQAVDPYNATGYNNPQLEKAFQGSLAGVPASEQPTQATQGGEDKPWYDPIFHGGGSSKLTPQERAEYLTTGNQLKTETDPQMQAQLQQRMDELSNPDRGGYMGALGRMLGGTGQTTGENIGTGAMAVGGPLIMKLVQMYLANKASKSVMNRNASNMGALTNQMQSSING